MAGRAQVALAALSVAALAGVVWMGARALDPPPMRQPAGAGSSTAAERPGAAPAASSVDADPPPVDAAPGGRGADAAPAPGAGPDAAADAQLGAASGPAGPDPAAGDGAAAQRAVVLAAVDDWTAGAGLPDDVAAAVLDLYDELMAEGEALQERVDAGTLSPEAAEAARMELRQEGRVELEDLLEPSELVELRRAITAAGGGRL